MSYTDELLASKFDDIERDIGGIVQIGSPALPSIQLVSREGNPLPKGPMPDYVQHKEGVNQLGKLSAEVIVREYDAAVKEIEALGAELTDAARRCEAAVASVHSMVSEIRELAASYREEGKRYFLQIEECSLMTSEVRMVCEAVKNKLARTIASGSNS
jgi:hypothetical protein